MSALQVYLPQKYGLYLLKSSNMALSYFVGFGGLGQMGVMIAKAMGNNVTVISTSTKKEASAREMGATNFVVSKDPESLKANDQTLHLILNTISVPHDLANYLGLLKKTGTIVQLGAFPKPLEVRECLRAASARSSECA
jgi:uncharacterized zinc-type alcohol dehydrogenase-like protein